MKRTKRWARRTTRTLGTPPGARGTGASQQQRRTSFQVRLPSLELLAAKLLHCNFVTKFATGSAAFLMRSAQFSLAGLVLRLPELLFPLAQEYSYKPVGEERWYVLRPFSRNSVQRLSLGRIWFYWFPFLFWLYRNFFSVLFCARE